MSTAVLDHAPAAEGFGRRPAARGTTTMVLADGDLLFRAGLGALLQREPDFDVVGEVGRGDEVVRCALRTRPSIVVLESRLPGLDGIAASLALRLSCPRTAVLILTRTTRPEDLRRALAAGVLGFLGKDVGPATLVSAIRAVGAGLRAVDPALERAAAMPSGAPSARELTILGLIARGDSNREIASGLELSQGTVRNYVSSMIARSQARNRVDLVRIGRERGWL